MAVTVEWKIWRTCPLVVDWLPKRCRERVELVSVIVAGRCAVSASHRAKERQSNRISCRRRWGTGRTSVANGHLAPPGKQRTNQRRTGDRLATVAAAEEMTAGTPSGSSDDRGDASPDRRSPTGSLPSAGVMASPRSNRSAVSAGGDDDDEENIDELFQSHASVQSFTDSKRSSNLLSPFTASRESIASYYSDAGEGNYGKIPVTGEVSFGLDYNYKNNIFEIHVKQCRDLAVVDTKKKRSDPYVKTYLLPDKTKSGKRKTRVKKHTLNPSYDETLRYQITKSELENRTLWLTVWHNDTFGRNDFLGEVSIPMDEYTFTKTSPRWYPLQDRFIPPADEQTNSMSRLAYKGDLIVSLKFVTCDYLMNKRRGRGGERGELQVLIKEARNLTAVRANGTSDPFCKGYLLPEKTKHAKQKTPVKKKDCNPTWNHTFVFEDIAWADLKERSLELTVWDHDRFTSNDFLGGVRLGLGTGTSGGRPVDWMDSQGEEVTIWKSMLERPNVWIDGTLILRPSMEGRK
ncbi:hypothetical protein LSH36_698g01047 [Paralvinella palmiformis]|uniref:C2 domain-containing protein n=1 Tax=Paralvinella palmiformis TaxID=53620 RepID=A0AAD9MV21_9ANNE|nr:hypothetical protein LSH36_698g01047 [Paralvinella palmiformis]